MESSWIDTEDWHTAGEPFRIVEHLPPGHLPAGQTVAQRRLTILQSTNHPLDTLRKTLCHEPRGHADMYGGFIVPPDDPGAHFGVLFWHKDGFSTACGHGTIALGYWAVNKGLVKVPNGESHVDVKIDVPSGRVVATMAVKAGKIVHADFVNVASYQLAQGIEVDLGSRNTKIQVDLSFGGAVYASVDATALGLRVEPSSYHTFVALGREIKAALGRRAHYGDYDLYGVIFFNDETGAEADEDMITQRNVTIFADGQIDRSPCGSGTCARVAILHAQGRIGASRSKLLHYSIVGSAFVADIVSEAQSPIENFPACIPRVRGQANLVGRMSFFLDPTDPVFPGFVFR